VRVDVNGVGIEYEVTGDEATGEVNRLLIDFLSA
jgi:hypothetical protein